MLNYAQQLGLQPGLVKPEPRHLPWHPQELRHFQPQSSNSRKAIARWINTGQIEHTVEEAEPEALAHHAVEALAPHAIRVIEVSTHYAMAIDPKADSQRKSAMFATNQGAGQPSTRWKNEREPLIAFANREPTSLIKSLHHRSLAPSSLTMRAWNLILRINHLATNPHSTLPTLSMNTVAIQLS